MKCQSLFSGENKKKYFKMSSAKILTKHAKGLKKNSWAQLFKASLA